MNRLERGEKGSALLIVMLLLALMGLIGFAGLEAVTRDQRVAGYQKRQRIAFFAAEAGVAESMQSLKIDADPTITSSSLGDTSIFPSGLPTYDLDSSSGASTTNMGIGAFPGMNMQITQNGAPQFTLRYWRVRVKGEAPGGSLSRIEFVGGAMETN